MLSGCVGAPPPGGEPKPEWAIRVSEVADRLSQSEQSQRAAMADLNNRLALLEKQIGTMQGGIEELRHGQKTLTERLDLIPPPEPKTAHAPAPLPAEPPAEESAPPVAETPPATTVASAAPPVIAAVKSPDVPAAAPKDPYEAAYLLLKQKKFEESLVAFQNFLKNAPKDKRADNAQYWVGELHYVQRHFPEALMAFNQVLLRWPNSDKVPDSLLKIGFSFYELNDMENANNSLQRLVKDFPASSSATVAKPRLALIKQKLGR